MLKKKEVNQLTQIVEKGIEAVEQDGYKRYYLQFVRWEKKERYWLVGFYTKETNLKFIGVVVKYSLRLRGYFSAGRSYG